MSNQPTIFTYDSNNVNNGDRGNTPSPQGLVNMRTKYDGLLVTKRSGQSMALPVYGLPNQRALDVCAGEILFSQKMDDTSNHFGETRVISSFNAEGPDIEQLYKHDEEQKISAILNRYKVVGVSQTSCKSTSADEEPMLTCQVGGVVGFIATTKLPTGCYSMIKPVTPSTARSENRITPSGFEPGKVVGELTPYDPRVIGIRLRHNTLNFLKDRAKYIKCMKAGLRSTDAWVTSLTTVCKFEILSFLLGLEHFVKKGLISVLIHNNDINQEVFFPANARRKETVAAVTTQVPTLVTTLAAHPAEANTALDGGGVALENLSLTNLLIRLAKSMGLLGPEVLVPNSTISKIKETQWNDLVREFNLKCHYDGEISNLAVLFNPLTNDIPGKSSSTGAIHTSRPEGAFLKMQLNLHEALYSALSQAIVSQHEWLGPKVIKGALPQSMASTLWA